MKRSQAAPAGETQTMTAAAPGGHRAKKVAANTRFGTKTATAAGGRVYSHSSRASDGSIPADDRDRRPEVPTGVGPMFNMQCGEARDSSVEV